MTRASIEIRDELDPALNRLVANAEDPAAIMDDVAGYLLFSTQRRFETETDPDGNKWKPLKARTAAARRGRRIRGKDHILRDTVRLYNSLTTSSDATSATLGTNVVYAAIHQFGGPIRQGARSQSLSLKRIRGKKGVRIVKPGTKGSEARTVAIPAREINMPPRPYLGINDADRAEIATIINDGIARGLK